jgi:hypothetical protein
MSGEHHTLRRKGSPTTDSLSRYRDMPTFGRDTIRRFTNNVSEMKQLAARDWEDLLQVRYLFLYA